MTLPIEHKAGDFYHNGLKVINPQVLGKKDTSMFSDMFVLKYPIKTTEGRTIFRTDQTVQIDFEGSYEVREIKIDYDVIEGWEYQKMAFLLPQSEQKTEEKFDPFLVCGPDREKKAREKRERLTNKIKPTNSTMDIYARRGTKVRGIFDEQGKGVNGYDFDKRRIEELLKPGEWYTVDRTEVSQSSTAVYLIEFPNKVFNSVCLTDEKEPVISSNVIQESDTLDQKIWKLIQATPQFSSNPEDYIKPFRELIKNELESEAVQFAELKEHNQVLAETVAKLQILQGERAAKISSLESENRRLETELDKFYKGNY